MPKKGTSSKSHDLLEQQIGKNLKAFRLDQNLSQSDLADMAGISRRTITSVENGQGCTLSTLIRLVRALGKDDLLSRLLEPPPVSPTKLHQANQILQSSRRHASKPRKPTPDSSPWTWGDK